MDTDLVRALRTRGVDVLTASEAGMIERLIGTKSEEEMRNQVEFLSAWGQVDSSKWA